MGVWQSEESPSSPEGPGYKKLLWLEWAWMS